eukprot:TRINITY_DN2383_c0_g1_i1.p1 TRINITY_DN2383_c0_g1~~TRINITY_DN2383_c0_g1_i1.p1  ORF type:complete len:308 (+),score=49.26 TRINITY_DN2383_c0_g1_i1:88-924(+)
MDDDVECIMVVVKSVRGEVYDLVVNKKGTVEDMQEAFEEQHDIPASEQRLIHKGRVLNRYMTVEGLGIEEGHVLHFSRIKREEVPRVVVPREEPSMPNDDMMRGMAPLMQMLSDNPEMMRSLMTSMSPNLARAMDNNPQLAAIMNDPATLRQAADMMRNPGLMAEMSRNMDRQVTQIMNIPGGAQHLERVFHDLEDVTPTVPEPARVHIPTPPPNVPLPNPWQTSQPVPPRPAPAAQDYSTQLRYMNEMGFNDNTANLNALRACNGDVDSAVNRLLNR